MIARAYCPGHASCRILPALVDSLETPRGQNSLLPRGDRERLGPRGGGRGRALSGIPGVRPLPCVIYTVQPPAERSSAFPSSIRNAPTNSHPRDTHNDDDAWTEVCDDGRGNGGEARVGQEGGDGRGVWVWGRDGEGLVDEGRGES